MKPKFQNSPHFKNYWEKGNGKELLGWSGVKPNPETFEKFAPLYHEVDDLGDEVVKETYLKHTYQEAGTIIKKYSKHPLSENDEVSNSIKKFFLQMQKIPPWFDENLANIGARFCMRTGPNGLIILRDYILMGGYDFAYLSKPLIFTGASKKGAVKRIKDTLEFWIHVTRENALKKNSEAYQLIIRTRLMHSYARLKIKENKNWDFENWGEPINSWDMIATYTGFSLVFMQGLKKIGIKISEEEEKGVFHLWKYIGHLLGIPAEFLPENVQEAVEQFYWWTTIQEKGDNDSALLAQALLQENIENTIFKYAIQRKIMLQLHQSMNWFLLDEEINNRLQIPKPKKVFLFFPNILRKANQISQIIYLRNQKQIQKLVAMGSAQQEEILADYLEHTPKDFHY